MWWCVQCGVLATTTLPCLLLHLAAATGPRSPPSHRTGWSCVEQAPSSYSQYWTSSISINSIFTQTNWLVSRFYLHFKLQFCVFMDFKDWDVSKRLLTICVPCVSLEPGGGWWYQDPRLCFPIHYNTLSQPVPGFPPHFGIMLPAAAGLGDKNNRNGQKMSVGNVRI